MSHRLSKPTSPLDATEWEIRTRNSGHDPYNFTQSASTSGIAGPNSHGAEFVERDGDDHEHESQGLLSSSAGEGHLPFDGIEHLNRRRSLDKVSLLRRWLPGLAAVWAATTPELVAISLVYLVQGLLDITILAITYLLKDELKMQPAKLGLWVALGKSPWFIKPVWGFLSDAFPLFGYRRRSYLILVSLSGAIGWVGLSVLTSGPMSALMFLLLTNFGLAFGDVIVDAIVVELARKESSEHAGSLQSLCWGSRAVGSIGSAWWSGKLVALLGPRSVVGLAAVFPLAVTFTGCLISEERVTDRQHDKHVGQRSRAWALLVAQSGALWGALRRRSIWSPALFTFFWSAAPTADAAMFFFMTDSLSFSSEFLGRLQLFQGLAELLGVIVYNKFLKAVALRKVLGWTMVCGTISGMTQLILVTGANHRLGMSDKLFALGDSVFIQALHRIALMPVFVLSARICPEGVEATLFATLMSIGNASSSTSAALGSGLTAALGVRSGSLGRLPLLVTICTLSRLLALPMLGLLPASLDVESPAGAAAAAEGEIDTKEATQIGRTGVI